MAGIERVAISVWAGAFRTLSTRLPATRSAACADLHDGGQRHFRLVADTNPEELLTDAPAGRVAMTLSNQLSRRQAPPEYLEQRTTAVLDQAEGACRIVASGSHVCVDQSVSEAVAVFALLAANELLYVQGAHLQRRGRPDDGAMATGTVERRLRRTA